MSNNVFFDFNAEVPLFDSFKALKIITDQDHITGTDRWRHNTGRDSLAALDPQLELLVQKQPPSKFGKAENPSLWFAVHFYLALPALSYTFKKYGVEDPVTSKRRLNTEELGHYFPAFPYLANHYREYHEFAGQFGTPSEDVWKELLQVPLMDAPAGAPVTLILDRLPQYLQEKARLVLSGQGDSLVGRIILAYLLGLGIDANELNVDKRTERYVAPMHSSAPSRSLYDRLMTAQAEMGELEPFLGHYEEEQSLLLNDFFSLVTWFGRPHMVEMVIPGLAGAAEPVVLALSVLFTDIIEAGGPDYTSVPITELPSMQKFYATQSLEAIGRLSIIKDILSYDEADDGPDGIALRKFAAHLYPVDERKAEWGNPEYYVPDVRRSAGFETFRQDIANIIFSAALYAEDDNPDSTNIDALKQLTAQLMQCDTMARMRAVIFSGRRALDDLAIDWETRHAGHERVRVLRFVRQTFGLDTIQPVPIPLSEINKGFVGSHLESGMYYLSYQEAGEKLEMSIPVSAAAHHRSTVHYRTSKPGEKPRISAAGLPYNAWLEISGINGKPTVTIPVPGRVSFDPFGRAGSAHAGEVIGFGCSVHHASLVVVLTELASLGASREDLERVKEAFMKINNDKHERTDLATFQLAQVLNAIEKGERYTFHDFLKDHPQLANAPDRPQLSAYMQAGNTSVSWAEAQAARLSFGYPELYPYQAEYPVNPRASWYDGRNVELPEAEVTWHALSY